MSDFFYHLYYQFSSFLASNWLSLLLFFFPVVVCFELPFTLLTVLYAIKGWLRLVTRGYRSLPFYPLVTIVITAYSESRKELEVSLKTALEQLYPGRIEIMMIIDNATENTKTVAHMRELARRYQEVPNRDIVILEKKTRGGHASSMNLGLQKAKGLILIMLDADTSIDNTTVARVVPHFIKEEVIAVSGSLRVRNVEDSCWTKLQAIEYMCGIQLGRFGLTEIDAINNISGAFGVFRTRFLRQIGGWLNGAAEDLDLTVRMHAYSRRYPHLKIVAEPNAVGWTAAPVTFKRLFLQRLRWDGDLYFIYVRRHWRKFSRNIMGGKRAFLMSWYALYCQLMIPFILIFFYIYLLITYPLMTVIAISLLVYAFYFVLGAFQFFAYLIIVSERPSQDSQLIGWLIFMPIYQQVLRLLAGLFLLNEICFKGHQETSMAPWWVIRKTK